MEDRTLLSVVPTLPASWLAQPALATQLHDTPDGSGSWMPVGLTPNQIRGAYGLGTYDSSGTLNNAVMFHGIQGDGSGQTIAIVDSYDDPYALSDLNTFSAVL